LLGLKRRLDKRLADIETDRQRGLKLPEIAEGMVDEVVIKVHAMLNVTDPQELKIALSRFIERIEVSGTELTIFYSMAPPATRIVSTESDPQGLPNLMLYFCLNLTPY
jgi:hypothetical protein